MSSTDFQAQIYLARAFGLRYREIKEQGEVVISNERDEGKRRMMGVMLLRELRGFDACAMVVLLDDTAREHFKGHKSGR